jgi:hypothetical protein
MFLAIYLKSSSLSRSRKGPTFCGGRFGALFSIFAQFVNLHIIYLFHPISNIITDDFQIYCVRFSIYLLLSCLLLHCIFIHFIYTVRKKCLLSIFSSAFYSIQQSSYLFNDFWRNLSLSLSYSHYLLGVDSPPP